MPTCQHKMSTYAMLTYDTAKPLQDQSNFPTLFHMTDYQALLQQQRNKLNKALGHLSYSYNKVKQLPTDEDQLDEETLETWESFCARFARVVDLFLTKYLRSFILEQDPAFNGSLRDFVNQGEKLSLVDDTKTWMHVRELRNIAAHEYTSEDLAKFLETLREYTPQLLALEKSIN